MEKSEYVITTSDLLEYEGQVLFPTFRGFIRYIKKKKRDVKK